MFRGRVLSAPPLDESLLCSTVSKYLGPFPEGLIEFHILIDALDCPALGHPATIRAAAGTVALTTANDVFLDTVQRDKKIFGSVSIMSWIKEHGGIYRGFVQVFPAIRQKRTRGISVEQMNPNGHTLSYSPLKTNPIEHII
jgi:hypothetical protein